MLRKSLRYSKRVFGDICLFDPSSLPDPTNYSRYDYALLLLTALEICNKKLFKDLTVVYKEKAVEPELGNTPVNRELY